jgi:hypothetical protein
MLLLGLSLGSVTRNGFDMQELNAELANNTNPQPKPRTYSDQLHLLYGKIGISAVVAAARYQSVAKNSGHLPIAAEPDYRCLAFARRSTDDHPSQWKNWLVFLECRQ